VVRIKAIETDDLIPIWGWWSPASAHWASHHKFISPNVRINKFEKVNFPQNRQFIVHHYWSKYQVDGFVGGLPF
jgi:hypothetical protein